MKPWLTLLRDALGTAMIIACLFCHLIGNWLWLTGYGAMYLTFSFYLLRMPYVRNPVAEALAGLILYLILLPMAFGILTAIYADKAFGYTLLVITLIGFTMGGINRKPQALPENEIPT